MIKRYRLVVLATLLVLLMLAGLDHRTPGLAAPLQQPAISGESAVVLDGATGDILYDKNSHARVPPASLTKIATAIVGIEHGQLDERIPVDFDSYELVRDEEASIMGVKPGDDPTFEDLLYGLMLPSGADAAVLIARRIGGSEGHFVEMMNDKVRDLGLGDTNFMNPTGLDQAGHYSSAYDMAALARYGLRNATFRSLADTKKYTVTGQRTYDIWNLNRLLYSYDGADGVKIGYTENALETIVASATRDGHQLIVGVMRSNSRFTDAAALLDYYFAALAKGEVVRMPAPTPIPTSTPTPTATPIPTATLEPTPTPTASILPAQRQAAENAWAGLINGLGEALRSLLNAIPLGH